MHAFLNYCVNKSHGNKKYFHTQIQLCTTLLTLTKPVAQFQAYMGGCIKKILQIFYQ